jgi:hypothetical protein
MKPVSERSHDERLAIAYWWRRIGRGLGTTLILPIAFFAVSRRWAVFTVIPCGIGFATLSVVAWRRWKHEGFYSLGSIKRDDNRSGL